MSYYRDQSNPDGIHYPACLGIKAIYAALAIGLGLALGLDFVSTPLPGHMTARLVSDGAIVLSFVVMWLSWPTVVHTDPEGVGAGKEPRTHKRFIRWKEITRIEERAEIPLLPCGHWAGVHNWVIVVYGPPDIRPVHFNSRHSGREAFEGQMRRFGAPKIERKGEPESEPES
jgi:hypothetical protein